MKLTKLTTLAVITSALSLNAYAGESHSVRTSTGVSCSNSVAQDTVSFTGKFISDVNDQEKGYSPDAVTGTNSLSGQQDFEFFDNSTRFEGGVTYTKVIGAGDNLLDCSGLMDLEKQKFALEVEMQRLRVEQMRKQVEAAAAASQNNSTNASKLFD